MNPDEELQFPSYKLDLSGTTAFVFAETKQAAAELFRMLITHIDSFLEKHWNDGEIEMVYIITDAAVMHDFSVKTARRCRRLDLYQTWKNS